MHDSKQESHLGWVMEIIKIYPTVHEQLNWSELQDG